MSIIRADLLLVEHSKQEYTPTSELQHVETLLQQLESKLSDFYRILPRLDCRRGLMNIGGHVLKALFGIAVSSDVSQLHDTRDNLQTQNSDIVHSLTNQLTLVKKLISTAE
jgi:hypothetical protein